MPRDKVIVNGKTYIPIKVEKNYCTGNLNNTATCSKIESELKLLNEKINGESCDNFCNGEAFVYVEQPSEKLISGSTADYSPVASNEPFVEGKKFDDHSTRYDLLPPDALEEIAKVLTWGSFKYDDENWRKVPDAKRRYFAASQRHSWKYKRGEQLDDEHSLHHLAASITNLMFILQLELEELDTPERQAKIKELFKLKSQK